ncbi:MAG: FAD-dependent oxidoreductase, partial [FCB group bacterium]|nr:FAD-dependent oxidoreductase [FCB group bacterium]
MPTQLEAVAGRSWDAVVVGAGPAGALAARELARRGRSVLLVDKARFPRYKVCGCCLNARALSALDAVGLGGLAGRLGGIPLHTVLVGRCGHRIGVRLPGGMAVSREAFDAALVDAAREAGVTVLTETTGFAGSPDTDSRNVQLRRRDAVLETTTRLVIAADGLGGRLLREQGFDSPAQEESRVGAGVVAEAAPDTYEPGIIHMACGAGGYVGLVRIEDGRLNIAAAFALGFMKGAGGMGPAAAAVLESAGFPSVPDLNALSWRGTPALTRRATLVSAPRGCVLGDAAGYV